MEGKQAALNAQCAQSARDLTAGANATEPEAGGTPMTHEFLRLTQKKMLDPHAIDSPGAIQ